MDRRKFFKTVAAPVVVGSLGFKMAKEQTTIKGQHYDYIIMDDLIDHQAIKEDIDEVLSTEVLESVHKRTAEVMFGHVRTEIGDIFHVPRTGENFRITDISAEDDAITIERRFGGSPGGEIADDDVIWLLGSSEKPEKNSIRHRKDRRDELLETGRVDKSHFFEERLEPVVCQGKDLGFKKSNWSTEDALKSTKEVIDRSGMIDDGPIWDDDYTGWEDE